MLERVCACGRAFRTYPSINQRHCSISCSLRFQPRKPRRGSLVPCVVCGTPAYRNESEQAKGARYCSRACANLDQTKEPVLKSCAHCGIEMTLKPSYARVQYCSRACMAAGVTRRPLERVHNGRPARLDAKGYVLLWQPDHPNTSQKGWQPEHRLVVERILGRHLTSEEAVHHRNGVKDDNRAENLEVMDISDHAALSATDYRDAINAKLARLARYEQRFGPLPEED